MRRIVESRPFRAALAVVLAFGNGWTAHDPRRDEDYEASRRAVVDLLGGRTVAARWVLVVAGSVGAVLALPLALLLDAGAWVFGRAVR